MPEPPTVAYGQRLLEGLRGLFHVLHQRQTMEPATFGPALEQARNQLLTDGKDAPEGRPAQNMATRFRLRGKAYFHFITTPRVEPTNNLAEQAIHFVVLDRQVPQGTRSSRGQRWSERIWTAIATCTQQQHSVFEYLHQTIGNHLAGRPTPSLLPSGP